MKQLIKISLFLLFYTGCTSAMVHKELSGNFAEI